MDHIAYCQRQINRALQGVLLFFILTVLIPQTLLSQSCLPEGINFTTQAQIDSFPINYPGCTEIEGDVFISGYISNLSGLSVLISIQGNLIIELNPYALTSLMGLDNLINIGGDFECVGNLALTSLSGLSSLNQIGGNLRLESNDDLTDISGLAELELISEGINIQYNPLLNRLTGLENIHTLYETLWIVGNGSLTDLTGLNGLIGISGNVFINNNDALTCISGLNNLEHVLGYFHLSNNESLTNLSGLTQLNFVGGMLAISSNNALLSLLGLENLNAIGGDLVVENNNSLVSLDGLDQINAGSIFNLYITQNDALSSCDVQSVCEYLSNPNGTVLINDNAIGCNNPTEVLEACTVGITEKNTEPSLSTYPNPFTTSTTIEYELTEPSHVQLTIYNAIGETVLLADEGILPPGKHTYVWTPEGLPGGMYYAVLRSEEGVSVVKMIFK